MERWSSTELDAAGSDKQSEVRLVSALGQEETLAITPSENSIDDSRVKCSRVNDTFNSGAAVR